MSLKMKVGFQKDCFSDSYTFILFLISVNEFKIIDNCKL